MGEICVKYRPNKKDIKMFVFYYLNRIQHYNILIVSFFLLLVVSFLTWFLLVRNALLLVVIFTSLFFILYCSSRYVIPVIRFKEDKAKETVYRFSQNEIQIEAEETFVKMSWKHYKSIVITGNLYIFKLSPKGYWFLPNYIIKDMFEFENLIYSQKEKIGLKVKVL